MEHTKVNAGYKSNIQTAATHINWTYKQQQQRLRIENKITKPPNERDTQTAIPYM